LCVGLFLVPKCIALYASLVKTKRGAEAGWKEKKVPADNWGGNVLVGGGSDQHIV